MVEIFKNAISEYINKNLLQRIKSTGIYLLVPIVSFSISIFTSPIFAKYLSAEEFGYYGYYNSILTFISCFYGLLFQTYYMSIYFRENVDDRKKILTTLILFNVCWNLLFFPFSYLCIYLYFKWLHSAIPFFPYVLLTFGAGILGIYKGFVQVGFRLSKSPMRFFVFVASNGIITTFLSLYFVVYSGMGLVGRLLGAILSELFFLRFFKQINS